MPGRKRPGTIGRAGRLADGKRRIAAAGHAIPLRFRKLAWALRTNRLWQVDNPYTGYPRAPSFFKKVSTGR